MLNAPCPALAQPVVGPSALLSAGTSIQVLVPHSTWKNSDFLQAQALPACQRAPKKPSTTIMQGKGKNKVIIIVYNDRIISSSIIFASANSLKKKWDFLQCFSLTQGGWASPKLLLWVRGSDPQRVPPWSILPRVPGPGKSCSDSKTSSSFHFISSTSLHGGLQQLNAILGCNDS